MIQPFQCGNRFTGSITRMFSLPLGYSGSLPAAKGEKA